MANPGAEITLAPEDLQLILLALNWGVNSSAGACRLRLRPAGMVDAALRALMAKRLFPRDIYSEQFLDEGDKATGGLRSPLIRR